MMTQAEIQKAAIKYEEYTNYGIGQLYGSNDLIAAFVAGAKLVLNEGKCIHSFWVVPRTHDPGSDSVSECRLCGYRP